MPEERKIVRALGSLFSARNDVSVGIGDDCAEVRFGNAALLVASDQVIENVHYTPGTAPEKAGAKLMLRNLSDVAAMGGTPRWAVLTTAGCDRDAQYVLDFCRGVAAAAARYEVSVIGGDTANCASPGFVATLTILGESPETGAVTRSGAKAGDYLYVTGKIGNSFLSGRHLDFSPRLREGKFLAENRVASAMLDVSDGLLLDAARLAEASKISLQIEPEKVPLHPDAAAPGAWSDGEDYELIFTSSEKLENFWPDDLAPVTCWGRCVEGNGALLNPDGSLFQSERLGYEH